jgi:hypothetical protein
MDKSHELCPFAFPDDSLLQYPSGHVSPQKYCYPPGIFTTCGDASFLCAEVCVCVFLCVRERQKEHRVCV